ncbi:MAG: cysteine desulfurase / selenocysteine lyase [Burkholderiaceae bacterium]|nr:cysteine desulfurase / selenocysteine lyase [Burkholderiaceae bacterium]
MLTPLYLDNAATSWPKPPVVTAAVVRYLEQVGANPGRSGHRLSNEAGRIVDAAREVLAKLFGVRNPLRIVFGANCTEALNLALCGLLRAGDHVITSSMEHNSMMRPLRQLESEGVELTVVPCRPDGTIDCTLVEAAVLPNTVLIALTHASNVVGTLLPVAEIGQIARKHDLLLLVDAASTAGAFPIDVVADNIDLLAFAGHKSLLGPTGTGGLAIGERVDLSRLRPLMRGGTGSRSEFEAQPDFLPDKYESGTLNVMGLAGLGAGASWIRERGIEAIRAHHQTITQELIDGLGNIAGVTVYGTMDASKQVATVSFTINRMSPSEAGFLLDEEFNLQCRIGLQCAPAAHHTIGTFPEGTIRFAPGNFTDRNDVMRALEAVSRLAGRAR